MRSRYVLTLILAMALAVPLLAAGCGKPSQPEGAASTGPSAANAQPATPTAAGKATITAKGSDTLLQVAQALAEAYKTVEPNVDTSVVGGGSGTGFQALIEGTTDIADASRKINDAEVAACKGKGIDVEEKVVGYDGIAVIVNKANPIQQFTIDDLSAVYVGEITDWGKLGGKGEIVLLSRDSTSGTYEYFKEHVITKGDSKSKRDYAASAVKAPSNEQIRSQVADTPGAVGYIGLGYLNDTVKAVPIVNKSGKPVAPSVRTVKDGSYPISRPLFMYTKKGASPAVSAFLGWVVGPEGQKVVGDQGFVPL